MIRGVAALLCVLAFVFAVRGDEPDPVKTRLFAAKSAYDTDWTAIRKQTVEWFDQREEAARQAGNLKLLAQIRADRAELDDEGELSPTVPSLLRGRHDQALKALEATYALALREYTRDKKDAEAVAVAAELRNIRSRLNGIDLLALVNLKKHTVNGDWVKTGKSLSVITKDDHARLQLPYEPGEEYDIEIKCKRLVGTDTFGLGLVVGGHQVIAVLDSWPTRGHASGLQLLDGKEPVDGNRTTVRGRVLTDDRMSLLTYSVRAEKVEMAVDGKKVFSFSGEPKRLSAFPNYAPPNRKALFLFVAWKNVGVQIDSIVLTPVKGRGNILK